MKEGKVEHVFSFPWRQCSKAHWLKYPNEKFSPQVIHIDYLERSIDPKSGILHTKRLLTIRQNVPSIIMRILESDSESHLISREGDGDGDGNGNDDGPISLFIEESYICPKMKKLSLQTTNLTQRKFLACKEMIIYEEGPSLPSLPLPPPLITTSTPNTTSPQTKMTQRIQIQSMIGNIFYIGDALEEFSLSSFITNSSKGRSALQEALNRMNDKSN